MTTQKQTRDSFIFYRSFFSATKCLNQTEKAQLFDAICNYALDGKICNLDGTALGMFELIKPQLDANRKRFENGCVKKQKISKTEAKPKQKISKTEAKNKQNGSKTEANVNVNVNVNEECKSESKLECKSKRFIKPTLDEIKQYCIERKNNINAEKFINYYEANGWKIGKNAMKDWKACIRTWEGNDKSNNTNKPISAVYNQDTPRDYNDLAGFYD